MSIWAVFVLEISLATSLSFSFWGYEKDKEVAELSLGLCVRLAVSGFARGLPAKPEKKRRDRPAPDSPPTGQQRNKAKIRIK